MPPTQFFFSGLPSVMDNPSRTQDLCGSDRTAGESNWTENIMRERIGSFDRTDIPDVNDSEGMNDWADAITPCAHSNFAGNAEPMLSDIEAKIAREEASESPFIRSDDIKFVGGSDSMGTTMDESTGFDGVDMMEDNLMDGMLGDLINPELRDSEDNYGLEHTNLLGHMNASGEMESMMPEIDIEIAEGGATGSTSIVGGGGRESIHRNEYTNIVPEGSIRPRDVLKGRAYNQQGNDNLRVVAADRYHEYCASSKTQKILLKENIVQDIVIEGGRFLKPHGTNADGERLWKEMNALEAHEKVANAFRNITKRLRRHAETLVSPP